MPTKHRVKHLGYAVIYNIKQDLMLVKSYFSALDRGATQKKNDHPAVTATWSGGITSGNRKLAQGRDLSNNSGRNLKGIRKLSPHLGGELSGSGSIGGKLCTIQK